MLISHYSFLILPLPHLMVSLFPLDSLSSAFMSNMYVWLSLESTYECPINLSLQYENSGRTFLLSMDWEGKMYVPKDIAKSHGDLETHSPHYPPLFLPSVPFSPLPPLHTLPSNSMSYMCICVYN